MPSGTRAPRLLALAVVAVALAVLIGCGGDEATPAQILKNWPNAMSGRVSGHVGLFDFSGKPLSVSEGSSGSITWTPAPDSTGTEIDGSASSGSATPDMSFTLTGKTSNGRTITVTGMLGKNCQGNGRWSVTGTPEAFGTWTVP